MSTKLVVALLSVCALSSCRSARPYQPSEHANPFLVVFAGPLGALVECGVDKSDEESSQVEAEPAEEQEPSLKHLAD